MSTIRGTKPVFQKAEPFDTGKYQKTFRGKNCESCGKEDDGTVVGAHLNVNNGGTGYRVPGAVAALCSECHDIADGRAKALLVDRLMIWLRVLQRLLINRARLWEKDSVRRQPR